MEKIKKRKQILIVDDDPITCDILGGMLHAEGYELEFVSNGDNAIKFVKAFLPDTVLLDVIMPDMNGFEVCRRLKEDVMTSNIPIILITGLDSKNDLETGINAGAEDFLVKPVNGLELRARVRSMLRIKSQFDELQEEMVLREDMSNMIMHDLKNPLSAIVMAGQILQLNIKTPSDLKLVETMQSQARRLESIMNDMLTLSKMKEGRLMLKYEGIDIDNLLLELCKDYTSVASSRGISLILIPSGVLRKIKLDRNMFQRVLDNLITNAIKFSPKDSKITIRIEYMDSECDKENSSYSVSIKIADEGYGIPEKYHKDIFEKYKVVALKKDGVPQFGLGLAFCKMVMEAHGGHIHVKANEPKGSIFIVEL